MTDKGLFTASLTLLVINKALFISFLILFRVNEDLFGADLTFHRANKALFVASLILFVTDEVLSIVL